MYWIREEKGRKPIEDYLKQNRQLLGYNFLLPVKQEFSNYLVVLLDLSGKQEIIRHETCKQFSEAERSLVSALSHHSVTSF